MARQVIRTRLLSRLLYFFRRLPDAATDICLPPIRRRRYA